MSIADMYPQTWMPGPASRPAQSLPPVQIEAARDWSPYVVLGVVALVWLIGRSR